MAFDVRWYSNTFADIPINCCIISYICLWKCSGYFLLSLLTATELCFCTYVRTRWFEFNLMYYAICECNVDGELYMPNVLNLLLKIMINVCHNCSWGLWLTYWNAATEIHDKNPENAALISVIFVIVSILRSLTLELILIALMQLLIYSPQNKGNRSILQLPTQSSQQKSVFLVPKTGVQIFLGYFTLPVTGRYRATFFYWPKREHLLQALRLRIWHFSWQNTFTAIPILVVSEERVNWWRALETGTKQSSCLPEYFYCLWMLKITKQRDQSDQLDMLYFTAEEVDVRES